MKKKGTSVVWGFIIMFIALLFSIFLGLTVFTFSTVNDVLSQDVEVGQVNLKEISDLTFGQINLGIINNADTIGIIMLFGMCFLMMMHGYYFGSQNPKIFFVVDMFLLALFFIPSIYISQVYEIFINSTALFEDTFINIIPKTSKFMLNLPTIIGTVGVLTMILSYTGIRKDDAREEASIQGF